MTISSRSLRPVHRPGVWTVLINDYFNLTFEALTLTLQGAGFNVIGSSKPGDLLEILRSQTADCAILDLDAPNRSMTVADILTKQFVPFFFLGGLRGEDLGVHKGVEHFKKPISSEELLKEVDKMLKGRGDG